jgi:hypothetical protein
MTKRGRLSDAPPSNSTRNAPRGPRGTRRAPTPPTLPQSPRPLLSRVTPLLCADALPQRVRAQASTSKSPRGHD